MTTNSSGTTGIADPCPLCGREGSRVTDSRPYVGTAFRRRRRKCDPCGHAWTTLEVPADFLGRFRDARTKLAQARGVIEQLEALMAGIASPEEEDS